MKPRKRLKKWKVVFATASKWHEKLLNMYATQYDKLTKAQKKRIKVQNRLKTYLLIYI